MRVARRREPPHLALALAGRLVRVSRAVVRAFLPLLLDARQDRAPRRAVAGERVGDQHTRDGGAAVQQFANEIATICAQRFRRPVSQHSVQRLLAAGVPPSTAAWRFPRYRDIADPVERRLAVVRLYLERWTVKSIAAYLATKRDRVYAALRRWFAAGLPGLEDQSRAPKHPVRKVDRKALAAIRRQQANPELGGFRDGAALAQRAIFLSPRTCQRLLALHRDSGVATHPPTEPREPRPHPFAAARRHHLRS